MNYYIQGDAAKAEQIKAAFEAKGFVPRTAPMYYGSESVLFFTGEDNYIYETSSPWVMNIIKTHPDYEELEPLHKFKEGDLLVHNSNNTRFISVVDVSEKYGYQVQDGGSRHHLSFNVVENEYHLWSIADAKDGDVLVDEYTDTIGIFEETNGIYWNSKIYCAKSISAKVYHHGGSHHIKLTKPATRPQRDLLFRKMQEAGYQWDADKKELRKIKPHYDIANFKSKQWVLVRDDDEWEWALTRFSHLSKGSASLFVCINGASFQQCIPFENNKHLLGTADMCDEQYINW